MKINSLADYIGPLPVHVCRPKDTGKGLSMTATFRGHEGRHLVVYGDAKVPGRFVGVTVVVEEGTGGVQGVELSVRVE